MDADFDPYRILQVAEDAESEIIEAAYWRLCRKYHPDRSSSPDADERMRRINAAYEIIGDNHRRRKFDQLRRGVTHVLGREAPGGGAPALLIVETIVHLVRPASGARAIGRFELLNRGGGLLAGSLRPMTRLIRVSPTAFSVNRLVVEVRVERRLPDNQRRGSIAVETNGGRGVVDVLLPP